MNRNRNIGWRLLAAGAALGALTVANQGFAAEAAAAPVAADSNGPASTTTTEGVEVREVVVNVEAQSKASAAAPTKGNLKETQPESIITHKFIELATPEIGNYTTTMLIAPSLSGITSNGGGVGEYNKVNMRGFSDGQYNLTYDGIFFGDTNDPTHHPASFWPGSTIGAVVVDRGPGAAGDLGQANYGGAIHLFSPEVSDAMGFSQKATFSSFGTQGYVSTLNSGHIAQLGGTKILLNFDERKSDGELSYSGGQAQNQLFKSVTPFGDRYSLTLFAAHNFTRFNQSDAGPGETWNQVLAFGKNWALNNDPASEHYFGNNWQKKQTDFEYIDFKGAPGWGITFEDQAYTYFYSNKTLSVNDVTGFQGTDLNGSTYGASVSTNTDAPKFNGSTNLTSSTTDLGGYDKGNRYRVFGDIMRVNKDWSFGTLKLGAVIETSSTDRHNILYDLTTGNPDNRYAAISNGAPQNYKTFELSHWNQYQVFADFEWRPLTNLTVTPGFKYVNLTRSINALVENSGVTSFTRGPVSGSNTYDKPLYFLTTNYRILPYWSVYGQYATGFLIPALSTLQVNNLQLNQLKPQQSVNYQGGTVFSHGRITADADVYLIKLTNFAQPDPTGQFYINTGTAQYSGVEGQAAYAFDFGLTLFANGSANAAKNTTTNVQVNNAPKWTDAAGAIYSHGPWQGSFTYKVVGAYNYAAGQPELKGYDNVNAAIAYDFGNFKLKVQGVNLADRRAITTFSGTTLHSTSDKGLYQFQAGRELSVTLQAKF